MTNEYFFLCVGSNHLYVFVNPLNKKLAEGVPETIDWDFAQKELAENSGFSTLQSGLSKGMQRFRHSRKFDVKQFTSRFLDVSFASLLRYATVQQYFT